jgi:two-component system response regulator DegU
MWCGNTRRKGGLVTERIKIVVADDHDSFRESLIHLLSLDDEIEVIGEAADGVDAGRLVLDLHPDVAVLDLNMPGMDGAQTARHIKATLPEVGVVVLSVFSESRHIQRSLEAGADRYLTKGTSREDILAAVRAVAARGAQRVGSRPADAGESVRQVALGDA